MPTVPKRVVDRFNKKVGKFKRVLQGARDRDLNEAFISKQDLQEVLKFL